MREVQSAWPVGGGLARRIEGESHDLWLVGRNLCSPAVRIAGLDREFLTCFRSPETDGLFDTSFAEMTSAQAAALWSGLLIILLGLLATRMLFTRVAAREGVEHEPTSEGSVARSFRNAAEYVPLGVATLILFYHLEASAAAIHLLGGTLLLGRLVQAMSFGDGKARLLRRGGVGLTLLALFVCGGMLITLALS